MFKNEYEVKNSDMALKSTLQKYLYVNLQEITDNDLSLYILGQLKIFPNFWSQALNLTFHYSST